MSQSWWDCDKVEGTPLQLRRSLTRPTKFSRAILQIPPADSEDVFSQNRRVVFGKIPKGALGHRRRARWEDLGVSCFFLETPKIQQNGGFPLGFRLNFLGRDPSQCLCCPLRNAAAECHFAFFRWTLLLTARYEYMYIYIYTFMRDSFHFNKHMVMFQNEITRSPQYQSSIVGSYFCPTDACGTFPQFCLRTGSPVCRKKLCVFLLPPPKTAVFLLVSR